ncbi:hypothetical protein CFBP8129_45580 (plasmid) [Xanthomonas hortorum pv. gardneri]|jgi:hypothetical protein|uniref:Uncharacterized protein n=1 Tax=Xanthomonas hortorum pv. gardneri TaxID=2754056 RepID=A0A6V7FFI5_9XANT|nr:hypothetical protein CFBP8129_45580 [Xanthomonas hortorum pv. gardneri]CAD0362504.1 hypothetical protein CFBP8129_45580 [Xanthomonas hortorum pv. gardneri]
MRSDTDAVPSHPTPNQALAQAANALWAPHADRAYMDCKPI